MAIEVNSGGVGSPPSGSGELMITTAGTNTHAVQDLFTTPNDSDYMYTVQLLAIAEGTGNGDFPNDLNAALTGGQGRIELKVGPNTIVKFPFRDDVAPFDVMFVWHYVGVKVT